MNYQVIRILESEAAGRIAGDLRQNAFVDGKLTASGIAREVKHNLQMERTSPMPTEMDRAVLAAFSRNGEFQAFALPKKILPPLFNRYEPGMDYGAHVDNAIMGGANAIRTDLSVTLFLTPPSSYDGGELVLELPAGEQEIKLDAGEAIVYPSGSIHYVAPVSRGVRLAAAIWVQSCVRDERLRGILYDLHRALQQTEAAKNAALSLLLGKSYHNLIRYAAEP
jgi:PKHD-type hydroxylase